MSRLYSFCPSFTARGEDITTRVHDECDDWFCFYGRCCQRKGDTQVCHSHPLVFVDGACTRNGQPDARAGIGCAMGKDSEDQVSIAVTDAIDPGARRTSQRAELLAALHGVNMLVHADLKEHPEYTSPLECPHRQLEYIVAADSEYVVKGISEWVLEWKANHWKNNQGKSPKNIDLFKRLDATVAEYEEQGFKIHFLHSREDRFYVNITRPTNICPSPQGPSISHSGYIGLNGDSETEPKRSFFWYFEAEHGAKSAPVILTIGGGPGASGMINTLAAQGPCLAVENGTVPNPNRWTEHFNLLALDHPVGTGASYGTRVNNSRSAAIDVYDFLQKFFRVFPDLAQNQFILSGNSYGGIYVPHIATVIHEQNIALAKGKGQLGAIHINLESMMVSNPASDATSHYTWLLQTRCYNVEMYNASTCDEMFKILPTCLESIQFAQQTSGWSVERHVAAQNICHKLEEGDTHGTLIADVRKKCHSKHFVDCLPVFGWINNFFRQPDNKITLGIPEHVDFRTLADDVAEEFDKYGDIIQPAYLMYGPLLKAGIRLLHYVGANDAICASPGVISFLRLLQSPFQDEFLRAPDIPWPTTTQNATKPATSLTTTSLHL
ncbi:SET domain-containing protein [Mycena sanguinolenta]|uniref:SET domain-containing protein n=1 Tax=Mycena sanguinolenta TaxID=230812 RepID=A0A8H6XWT7_9AGAR|nr:SET domain-containing protein [Mycena sanguinolenta]